MVTRQLLILGLALCGIALGGCRTDKPRGLFGTKSTPSTMTRSSSSAKPSLASDPKYQKLIKELSSSNQKPSAWDKAVAPVESAGAKLKHAASRVARKMRPQPQVIATDDPVSLSSKPVKIGANVYYAAGRLAEHNSDVTEAVKQYRHALEVNPKHVPTLISLGRLYDRQDKFDQAVTVYQRAIAADPNNATVHNDLGLCLSRHGQPKEAIAELQRAIKITPTKKLYHNNLATVLIELGNTDQAWRQLSSVHPPAVAHYNLGYLLSRAGHKDEARRQFALAYQADRSLAVAKTMLDQLDAELGRHAPMVATAPGSRTIHKMSLRKQRQSKSHRFASMSGHGHLRRIPAPDPAAPVAPTPQPSAPQQRPVSPPSAPIVQPRATPATTSPPANQSRTLRFPVRPTAGFVSDDPELDAQLPTPESIETSTLQPAQPDLLPVP